MSGFAAGVAGTLFPCESWISMWKECWPNESLWQWRIIHSLKNTHFWGNRPTLVAQSRMQCVRGRNSLQLCLPMRNELPVERNTGYAWGFSCVRNTTVRPNSCIQLNGTRTVEDAWKPFIPAARGSGMLFKSENWGSFTKECDLSLRLLQCEEDYLCAK
jgi:hypothetical protein